MTLNKAIVWTRGAFLVWLLCFGVASCGGKVTDADLLVMTDTIRVYKEEVKRNQLDLATIVDPFDRKALEDKNEWMLKQITIFEESFASAKDAADAKWSTAEAILGVIGGFFPPALIGLPIIRTLRRQRTAIFDSIKAGGGPKDPTAARLALHENPSARKAFKRWKNGPAPTGMPPIGAP